LGPDKFFSPHRTEEENRIVVGVVTDGNMPSLPIDAWFNSFCFVGRMDLGSVIALAEVFAPRGPERVPT
jgi:hypothetical protein